MPPLLFTNPFDYVNSVFWEKRTSSGLWASGLCWALLGSGLEAETKFEVFEQLCLQPATERQTKLNSLGFDLPPGLFPDEQSLSKKASGQMFKDLLLRMMKIKEEESIYGPKSMQPDDMCVVESGALRLLTKHGIPGQEGGTELHRYGAGDVLGATQMAQGIESVTAAKQKGGKNAAKNVHDNSPTDVLACSGHDVVLLVFSLEVYEKYILDGQEPAHEKFRENIATLTHDNCSKWLRRFNFFDSLDQQQLTLLA